MLLLKNELSTVIFDNGFSYCAIVPDPNGQFNGRNWRNEENEDSIGAPNKLGRLVR